MSVLPLTFPPKKLAQSILSTDSSFVISNIVSWDGVNDLTAADLGTVAYAIFTNDTRTQLEIMQIDPSTIASSSITILSRGLSYSGAATSAAARKFSWTANETTIQLGTDFPQLFQYYKDYADGLAIAGAPNATTALQGLVELATQAEVDAGTATGGTGASLTPTPALIRAKKYHDYAVDSVGTDSYAITIVPAITAYSAGQIFTFKAGTANTGACTLNVSGLGAKTIKKDTTTDLATGDILANQIVMVQYDGTNMQMLSPISPSTPGNAPVVRTYLNAGSPATWTKPASLKYVIVEVQAGGGGGASVGAAGIGGGGGGGGYSRKLILAATLGATETVTTGAGGAASSSGGSSSFGSHATATGGAGGSSNAGGTGGVGSSGDINLSGGGGSGGDEWNNNGTGAASGGTGGSSKLGGGAPSVAAASDGAAGLVYGGGGGGGASPKSGSSQAGGVGAAGIVIVTEYYY